MCSETTKKTCHKHNPKPELITSKAAQSCHEAGWVYQHVKSDNIKMTTNTISLQF